MENIPSLEKVKEYFKDAKKVECISDIYKGKKLTIISKTIEYDTETEAYYCDCKESISDCLVWNINGYAKILSYKEPKDVFEISKEQILEIYGYCNSTELQNTVKQWFPPAFQEEKKELPKDFTGWVLDEAYPKVIAFSEKGFLKYGFDVNRNWVDNTETKLRYERLATPKEVEEAIGREFKNRYKKGDWIKCLNGVHVDIQGYSFEFKDNILYLSDTSNKYELFKDGKWATIIQPKQMTQQQIEKELGYNIEIIES